jgi:superfamily II DNA or RNA helicase
MQLRDYQERFVENIARSLKQHGRIVAQLATGGGKTVTFSAIAKRFHDKSGQRVLILVHRMELLTQAARTIKRNTGLEAVPIIAGMKSIPDAPIYVGMVETISRRFDKLPDIGLIIIDEAHIGNFKKVIKHYRDQYIIGFTATPLNATKKDPLNKYFKSIVCGVDIPELIDKGFLCSAVTRFSPDKIDTDKFKMMGGDYDSNEMALEYSNQKYISSTVKMYEKYSLGSKTLIFNCNVDHSLLVTQAFKNAGYDCRHLDGETENREEILKWFAETNDAILCNVFIATTGFDQPDIRTVIVNKSTLSLPLWLQMCGRGSRPTENKTVFQIIDLGGNVDLHNEWQVSRDWVYIFKNTKIPKDGIAPMKDCPKCDGRVHMRKLVCDLPIFRKNDNQLKMFIEDEIESELCGYVFPVRPIEEKVIDELKTYSRSIDIQRLIDETHNKGWNDYKTVRQIIDGIVHKIDKINEHIYAEAFDQAYRLTLQWAALKKKKINKGNLLTKFDQQYLTLRLEEQINLKFPQWKKSSSPVTAA